jgi:hypothetical protein
MAVTNGEYRTFGAASPPQVARDPGLAFGRAFAGVISERMRDSSARCPRRLGMTRGRPLRHSPLELGAWNWKARPLLHPRYGELPPRGGGSLPRKDLNLDKEIQNLSCYRYTTRQIRERRT